MAESKKCVLIIDDDKDVCQIIKVRFESLGYKVVTAYEGAEGFRKTEAEKPDCVLLDIRIPQGEDGLTYLRRIRSYCHDNLQEQSRVRKIPVIVLTAAGDAMKTVFEIEGISGFIKKPFNIASLHSKIQQILGTQ
jgi:two-component system alkaline phosphatase synthesis response regulator PhoP